MIGAGAIVMNVFMLALGLFLFVGALLDIVCRRRSGPRRVFDQRDTETAGWVVLGISAFFLLGLCNLFVREIHLHDDLSRLAPENVVRIEVGRKTLMDRGRIREIVDILKRPQWFSMSRGDAGDKVALVLCFRDGSDRQYLVTRYQRGAGVALESTSPYGWANGQVLYPELTGALQDAGIVLPQCRTIQGKPEHCAPGTEKP